MSSSASRSPSKSSRGNDRSPSPKREPKRHKLYATNLDANVLYLIYSFYRVTLGNFKMNLEVCSPNMVKSRPLSLKELTTMNIVLLLSTIRREKMHQSPWISSLLL